MTKFNKCTHMSLYQCLAEMCPGLGEWWLHKGIINLRNLVIFNIYAQTVSRIPCRHFVYVKWLARLSIFICADILVLVSGFVVVVILSQWWSVPTTADHCGHILILEMGRYRVQEYQCITPKVSQYHDTSLHLSISIINTQKQ